MSINAVANDLRPDENDQFGPDQAVCSVRKRATERSWQLIQKGDAGTAAFLALAAAAAIAITARNTTTASTRPAQLAFRRRFRRGGSYRGGCAAALGR